MIERKLSESYWPADDSRPILHRSIGEALAEASWEEGHREAIIEVVPASMTSPVGDADTKRKWTYSQLFDDAKKCATWLLREFKTGDRVCVWAPNVPEWVWRNQWDDFVRQSPHLPDARNNHRPKLTARSTQQRILAMLSRNHWR